MNASSSQELMFSADCAINFDDLGEYKDYSEDIESVLANLKTVVLNRQTRLKNKSSKQSQLQQQQGEITQTFSTDVLIDILKADPEDTFHNPLFKDILENLLALLNIQLSNNEQTQKKNISPDCILTTNYRLFYLVIHNFMEIMEDSFISYPFSQDIGPKICQWIIMQFRNPKPSNKHQHHETNTRIMNKSKYMKQFIYHLSKLSKKLCYVENHELYVKMLLCFDQIDILSIEKQTDASQEAKNQIQEIKLQSLSESLQETKEMLMTAYLSILEMSLRNRHIRKLIKKSLNQAKENTEANDQSPSLKHLLLRYKLSLWTNRSSLNKNVNFTQNLQSEIEEIFQIKKENKTSGFNNNTGNIKSRESKVPQIVALLLSVSSQQVKN